ncbi:MAG: hypothetical protein ISS71_05475 [Phycisphaerae bacterium]|nr:hypothetical protein [Phycisphaerae bacterium]
MKTYLISVFDGSIVVGYSRSSTAPLAYEAFRWENGIMIGSGDLAG